jgi:DNA-binding response OmpR family regulator
VISEPESCLRDKRILVVEDELLIAMTIEQILLDEGCVVLGPAPSVAAALELIDRTPPDAALLDVNLNGHLSTPVAAALTRRGIPHLLVTGYIDLVLADPVLKRAPYLAKPFTPMGLLARMQQIFCRPTPQT